MKKFLARCLVLALALCLVCSSCFAEAGYEAIKEYLNNSSAGEGTLVDASSVGANPIVMLCFSLEDYGMWLGGVNAQGKNELTLWSPSYSTFYEVMKDCVGRWDELSSYPSDGYGLVIAIQTTGDDDPLYIMDADMAKEVYDLLSSD